MLPKWIALHWEKKGLADDRGKREGAHLSSSAGEDGSSRAGVGLHEDGLVHTDGVPLCAARGGRRRGRVSTDEEEVRGGGWAARMWLVGVWEVVEAGWSL